MIPAADLAVLVGGKRHRGLMLAPSSIDHYLWQLGLEAGFLSQGIIDGLQEAPLYHIEGLKGHRTREGLAQTIPSPPAKMSLWRVTDPQHSW